MSEYAEIPFSSYISGNTAENAQNRADELERRAVFAFAAAYDAAGEAMQNSHGTEEQQIAWESWWEKLYHNTLENLSPAQYEIFCEYFGPSYPNESPSVD